MLDAHRIYLNTRSRFRRMLLAVSPKKPRYTVFKVVRMIQFPFRMRDRASVPAAGVALNGIKPAFASVCVARGARDRERVRVSHERR